MTEFLLLKKKKKKSSLRECQMTQRTDQLYIFWPLTIPLRESPARNEAVFWKKMSKKSMK